MPMVTDRSGEDEEPREPTYMPIVPAGMSTSAPAPQVCLSSVVAEAITCRNTRLTLHCSWSCTGHQGCRDACAFR